MVRFEDIFGVAEWQVGAEMILKDLKISALFAKQKLFYAFDRSQFELKKAEVQKDLVLEAEKLNSLIKEMERNSAKYAPFLKLKSLSKIDSQKIRLAVEEVQWFDWRKKEDNKNSR